MAQGSKSGPGGGNNAMLAVTLAGVFIGMIGVTFASVPLYRLFCQATGYGGTVRTDASPQAATVLDRTITVRFDANTFDKLPWRFEPVQREIAIRIGETAHVKYVATNLSDHPTTGHASFNVSPDLAGAYFDKVQCFCFTSQTLAPHETKEMDVVFYVDPEIVKSRDLGYLRTITLSYTMYPGDGSEPVAAAATDVQGKKL